LKKIKLNQNAMKEKSIKNNKDKKNTMQEAHLEI
jgi:hypothetical protein